MLNFKLLKQLIDKHICQIRKTCHLSKIEYNSSLVTVAKSEGEGGEGDWKEERERTKSQTVV